MGIKRRLRKLKLYHATLNKAKPPEVKQKEELAPPVKEELIEEVEIIVPAFKTETIIRAKKPKMLLLKLVNEHKKSELQNILDTLGVNYSETLTKPQLGRLILKERQENNEE